MSDIIPDITIPTKVTGNTVITIVDGASLSLVCELFITEIAGSTPNLTLEIYDGTTSTYFVKTKPMTALQGLVWENIPLSPIQKLRVTAGTANQIDVIATAVSRRPTG